MALALGEWDVDTMAANMRMGLFYEWQAYARMNPFGQQRHDWNAAMAAATVSNTLIAVLTKSHKRLQIGDLMFKGGRQKRKKTPKEMYRLVRTMALVMNQRAGRNGNT